MLHPWVDVEKCEVRREQIKCSSLKIFVARCAD